ncbi:MAG: ester cyclase, partial [Candidatus Acidiferrales bacterium]
NKPVAVGGVSIAKYANGQIVEAWDHWDKLAMLQQIGAVPALATKTAAG